MFEQSKLKIKRANQHIAQLEAYIASLSDSLYSLSIEKNSQTGRAGLVCRMRSNETDIPLFIGDIAHNLHSSLDILYCDILRHEGHSVNKHSKWPFRKSREELEAGLVNREEKNRLSKGIIELIVNTIQTYRGGKGDELYGLHDLNINDKHMLLVPTFNICSVSGIEFIDEAGAIGTMNCSSFGGGGACTFFGEGAQFRSEAANDIVGIKSHGKATFEVLFGNGAFHGQPIIQTFKKLSLIVSETVMEIENFLNSTRG